MRFDYECYVEGDNKFVPPPCTSSITATVL